MVSFRACCIGLFFIASTLPNSASTLNFDDIDASAGDVILTSYQSYTITNFSAYTSVPGFSGFNNGIFSSPNAAYSSGLGSISSGTTFDFTGAELGSGYYDNLQLTIEGLLGGTVYYDQTVTVSTTGAQPFSFNFKGIDKVLFTTSTTASTTDPYYCGAVGCSYFTIDDAVLTPDLGPPPAPPPPPPPPPSTIPEPPAWTLLALGLLAMLPVCRMRLSSP